MDQPNYYAIIPANIRYSKELSMFQKLLYAEITALTQKDGFCWASNTYFAKLYDKTPETISRNISDLAKKGFLKLSIDKEKGNQRKIYIGEIRRASGKTVNVNTIDENVKPIDKKIKTYGQKSQDPIDENVKHNNTRLIIKNNKEKIDKKEKSFLNLFQEKIDTPTIESIKNKFSLDAEEIKSYAEDFILYWTEKSHLGRKEKWKKQTSFDIRRRFYFWIKKGQNWNQGNKSKRQVNSYESVF